MIRDGYNAGIHKKTKFLAHNARRLLTFSYLCIDKQVKTMRTSQEYIDIIRSHAAELRQQFGITSMRLFGSVARNEHHEGSDVDIYVTMPPKFFNYIQAAQYLEELLGCSVDLISNHKNLRPFFKEQIERDGIDIFTAA